MYLDGYDIAVYEPVGCASCDNAGSRGRIGVDEIMDIDNDIKRVIAGGGDAEAIKQVALQNGMRTLRMSATQYVINGITSIAEMKKVSYEE